MTSTIHTASFVRSRSFEQFKNVFTALTLNEDENFEQTLTGLDILKEIEKETKEEKVIKTPLRSNARRARVIFVRNIRKPTVESLKRPYQGLGPRVKEIWTSLGSRRKGAPRGQ